MVVFDLGRDSRDVRFCIFHSTPIVTELTFPGQAQNIEGKLH